MAVTEQSYTGNGSTTNYSFTFPYLKSTDITVQVDDAVTTAWSLANATTVQFNTAPANDAAIKILRKTNVDNLTATFYAGSAIKSEDLNDNYTQNLYVTQEIGNRSFENTGLSTMIGNLNMGEDTKIVFEGATDNAHETTLTVVDPTADRTITIPNETGTVVTTGSTSVVTSTMITDGTIVDADVNASAAIAGSKLAAATTSAPGSMSAADKTKLDAIETAATADQTAAEIRTLVEAASDSNVFTDADHSKLNAIEANATADQTNAEIRAAVEAASDSNVFTDADHTKLNGIEASATADQTNAEIRAAVEAASDSNVFTDADHTKLNGIEASATADQTVTEIKSLIAGSPLDASHLAADSVTTSEIADAELTTLAGMQSGTASILSGSTALTSTLTELNMLDGKSIVTTISSPTDVQLPTAQAVEERIVDLVTDVGGFRPIANETSFPTTNPDPEDNAGTIVSVKALASNLTSNGSGVATIANGAGSGNTVTINGMANSDTIEAGKGILVETTSTLHTYTFHRETLSPADITTANTAVSDFNNRYRILASGTNINTVGSLDDGDLLWDSNVNKMKVYDATASQWSEVTSVGDYKLLTILDTDGSAFDGANQSFNLKDGSSAASVTSAGQLIISVNGVIQKPNAGTSAPSEGFALVDADTIIFSNAPGAGASVFVTLIGSATAVNTPATNSIVEAAIQTNVVSEEKLKIHQNPSDGKFLKYTSANGMEWGDVPAGVGGATGADFNDDVKLRFGHDDGGSGGDVDSIQGQLWWDETNNYFNLGLNTGSNEKIDISAQTVEIRGVNRSSNMAIFRSTGAADLMYNNAKKFETTSAGVTVTGDLTFSDSSSNDIILQGGKIYGETAATGALTIQSTNGNANHAAIVIGENYGSDNGGITFYGAGSSAADVKMRIRGTTDNIEIPDSHKLNFGDSNDLQIFHDGFHSYIKDEGTGELKLTSDGNGVVLLKGTSENLARFLVDGACELYYDDSKKFETTSAGVTITGDLTVTGSAPGGTSTGETYVKLYTAAGVASNSGGTTSAGSSAGTKGNESTYYGLEAGKSVTDGGANTLIGGKAGENVTSGGNNTALGQDCLKQCSTASSNTAIGAKALQNCTVAQNTAVGSNAGDAVTTAQDCTFVGWHAGGGVTEGNYNIGIGNECLMGATTGTANVNVGRDGLRAVTSGSYNVALGNDTNRTCTTGNNNVSIGFEALFNNNASDNIAVGRGAGKNITSGASNVLIGHEAGRDINSGFNVFIGLNSGKDNSEQGNSNTAVGAYTMAAATAGDGTDNSSIGYAAGYNITSGDGNAFLGHAAGYTITTGSHNVCIGNNAGRDQISTHSDNLYIARANVDQANAAAWIVGGSTGACVQGNNSSSWSTTSDERIKKNIVDNTEGLSVIDKVKVRNFKYKQYSQDSETNLYTTPINSEDTINLSSFPSGTTAHQVVARQGVTETQIGVIAQELESVCPGCVNTNDKGVKSVDTDELFWHMINAIKELSTKNDALEARIATLEAA